MGKNQVKNVAIVGSGAAGCICAYFLLKAGLRVTLFDKNNPLETLLPTGGGRCNLAHAEFDPKGLASNYPRGEKFLYSVFSKFGTYETLEMFKEFGVETYTQEDGRIFPESNSSAKVREAVLNKLHILEAKFIKQEIADITDLSEKFDCIVIATGGHSRYIILDKYNIKIIPPKPSLVGLKTEENLSGLSGVPVKNVMIDNLCGDLLFTGFGLSGPLIYKISSLKAFDKMPYVLKINFTPDLDNLQEHFNKNPHKEIKNILSGFIPKNLVEFLFKDIDLTMKAHTVNGNLRELITDRLRNFKVKIIGTNKGSETVTAGGIDLNEINPKTMELKKIPDVYCIGEVLNIDGFCGGFNLQNAWSTAYICAEGIIQKGLP